MPKRQWTMPRELTDADIELLREYVRKSLAEEVRFTDETGKLPLDLQAFNVAALTLVALDRLDYLRDAMTELAEKVLHLNQELNTKLELVRDLQARTPLSVYQ